VPGDNLDLVDPVAVFAAFADSARNLQAWHDGELAARPPGRLRPYDAPRLSRSTLAWATPLYRTIYDPDARPRALRRRRQF
jgi:hypothetical protein